MADTSKQDVDFLQQFEPDVFWQQHGKKILTGLAVVVLVGLVFYFRQKQAADQAEAAAAELANAVSPAALQKLAEEFRGKEIGAQALFRLAELEARTGRFAEAGQAFQAVLAQYPNHPMAESAQLGLAVIQEAQGDFQGAKSRYQQILVGHPGGYTAVAAKIGLARCAEGLGLTKEAQQAYEELRAVTRGSPWETEIYVRSIVLGRTHTEAPIDVPAPSDTSSVTIPVVPLADTAP